MPLQKDILLNPSEIKLSFVTSSGPGGQNVNKVATAAQLRFDVLRSPSLSEDVRARLVGLLGARLTGQGELIIKANCYRTQEHNKRDALHRLYRLLRQAATPPKKRKPTKPTLASKQRRLKNKRCQGAQKILRQSKIDNHDER